jgi:glycosyltransferase involved in cell wall biosynthesis
MPAEKERRLANRLTHLVFVPDNKLGWLPFARRAAVSAHRRTPFDVVLSSAPPYTSHLVATSVSRRLWLPLVVDFRDDWVGNPRHEYPTSLHRRVHRQLERKVIGASHTCVTINGVIADSLLKRSHTREGNQNVVVIPQGFDPADFDGETTPEQDDDNRMHFLYAGVFYDAQSPEPFLRGLRRAIESRPALEQSVVADFVGLVPSEFSTWVDELGLRGVVRHHGYESHGEVVARIRTAEVLWMTIGRQSGEEGISTGKLYEYIGARKPILGLVPDGVAKDDLGKYGPAVTARPDDPADIARAILEVVDLCQSPNLPRVNDGLVRQFDRRLQTARLADVLNAAANVRGE